MGFFSKIFGSSKETKENQQLNVRKEASGISYDPNLVSQLKADHQQLLSIFGAISQAAEEGRYQHVQENLKKLKMGLQAHLVTENVRFYVYVQQKLAKDDSASSLISGLRKDMDGIARAAVQFVNKYETVSFTPEIAANFRKELAGIGDVLVQRIQTEESSLYTLYQPAY